MRKSDQIDNFKDEQKIFIVLVSFGIFKFSGNYRTGANEKIDKGKCEIMSIISSHDQTRYRRLNYQTFGIERRSSFEFQANTVHSVYYTVHSITVIGFEKFDAKHRSVGRRTIKVVFLSMSRLSFQSFLTMKI